MRPRFLPIAAAAFLCFAASVHAADFNMKVTTEDITLGNHVVGPELRSDDLKHRVVLLEFWGIN